MHDHAAGGAGPEPNEICLILLQDFPALVWRRDTHGACDWFNTTWLEFTGRTIEDELGDGLVEGVHPDDRQRCVDTWTHNFAARRPFVMEYRLMHHDGEYRWIRDFGRPIHGADRFKECNDRFGHEKGDSVLREIAQVMKATVREMDTVARIGGDEFGVLLRGQTGEVIQDIEARLREAVEQCGAGYGLDLGLSIGAATIGGDRTASQVLAEADTRMYESKRLQAR
jgi:diguanylate cyclase (GGDEF)-like protein